MPDPPCCRLPGLDISKQRQTLRHRQGGGRREPLRGSFIGLSDPTTAQYNSKAQPNGMDRACNRRNTLKVVISLWALRARLYGHGGNCPASYRRVTGESPASYPASFRQVPGARERARELAREGNSPGNSPVKVTRQVTSELASELARDVL